MSRDSAHRILGGDQAREFEYSPDHPEAEAGILEQMQNFHLAAVQAANLISYISPPKLRLVIGTECIPADTGWYVVRPKNCCE
jgi:hypothetical protein